MIIRGVLFQLCATESGNYARVLEAFMKKKSYRIDVTDKNNVSQNYSVEVRSASPECKAHKIKYAFVFLVVLDLLFFAFLICCIYVSRLGRTEVTNCDKIFIVIMFSVLCIISSICLTIIYVKDDDGIRLAKLDFLTELEEYCSKKGKDCVVKEKYNGKGGIQSKKTEHFGGVTKTLMNSITEI